MRAQRLSGLKASASAELAGSIESGSGEDLPMKVPCRS